MSSAISSHPRARLVEKILALMAALVCLLITVSVWQSIASRQSMWPFPALYLIEVLALSAMPAALTIVESRLSPSLTWVAAGAVFAFAVLAMFSIGLLYVPVVGLLIAVGVIVTWRTRSRALVSAAWALGAAVVQVMVMLIVISLM
ncbi:MAG: hypothetical protein M1546_06475 [Chloroflexi bacterium]|nr:hypothetical protein [Chloroflexota bacterium]